MRSTIALLPLIRAGHALDFGWSFEGEKYWAKEVARFPRNDTLASQLGPEGVGRFSIGSVDWPQFECPLQGYELPAGAYQVTAVGNSLVFGQVYNIKSDPAIAFMDGCVPGTTDADAWEEYSAGIPVPPSVGNGPLAGLRFAVKDIFHVEGLKTSGGSRAYRSTYGPQSFTNEIVAKSVAAGAQLVGKTKTIAFALGTPRNGWEVDYQDPWSFRGDGYQTTGGSSSGSSAAIAAYNWLDFTIGSDTGGSVRYPARFVGFYGLKPSHGVYNLTGILPAIAEQDTPGYMARSPSIFVRVGREWSKGTSLVQSSRLPSNIQYWSDEPPLEQPDAEAMKLDFFSRVQTALNLTSTSVNISASFQANVVPNTTLNDYYYTVYQDQNSVQSWDRIGKPLAEAYAAQNEGAFPPTDPVVNLTWADGANDTTRVRYPEAVRRREQYAAWFSMHILPISNATCSESIAAHSLHVPPSTVKYDQTPFHLVRGYANGMQASFAGFPEIVVPIGQVQYWSPFTRKAEWQTVTVAFAAAKGCDVVLLDLVEKLEKLGLLKEVMTGKVAYPVMV